MSDEAPELGNKRADYIAGTLKGLAGAVPIAGSALSELITHIIPGQREDRLEKYLHYLAARLDDLSKEVLNRSLNTPEDIYLFEEGAFQAVRALSDDRIERISEVVSQGIHGSTKDAIDAKRVLELLRNLDDDQIIVLSAYLWKNINDSDFHEAHSDLLMQPVMHLGSDAQAVNQHTLYQLVRQQLVRDGLLRPNFKKPKKGHLPEFDEKTGLMKSSGYELTPLGRLILRQIGLADEDEI